MRKRPRRKKRSEIERHVTEVLAPQGHVMLCTSRPAGVVEAGVVDARFAGVRWLKLAPLTDAQQREALVQRLGGAGVCWVKCWGGVLSKRGAIGKEVLGQVLGGC